MKIGLPNIFTTLWFLLMIGSGGTLSFEVISERVFAKDTILILKLVLMGVIIITLATLIFFFIKFQLLIVTNYKIVSIKPFLLKSRKIKLENIKTVRWENWDLKSSLFKTVELIESPENKISFSDFEFENFEKLIARIPKIAFTAKRNKIYQEQAKRNLSMTNFILIISILSLSSLLIRTIYGQEFTGIHLTACLALVLMIAASIKRRIAYVKIRKTAHNKVQ